VTCSTTTALPDFSQHSLAVVVEITLHMGEAISLIKQGMQSLIDNLQTTGYFTGYTLTTFFNLTNSGMP
jgi:hypothetical protein